MPSSGTTPVAKPEPAARTRWLREPLVHFAVLGALLFGVDHFFFAPKDDPRAITIDAAVDREARAVFAKERGRQPDADELYALRRVWLDNEVLYREGIAMGVDRGDNVIRDRVIFKVLGVVEAGLKRPPIEESVVRDWFEKNRARYDEPTRYDFQEAVLAGDRSESASRAFAAALNAGNPPADAQAGLRVFRDRPHGSVVETYGATFAKELEGAPPGEWRAIADRSGWRVMRLEATKPGAPARFDTMHDAVVADWIDAVMAEQRSAAIKSLAKKYAVRVEEAGK